MVGQQPTVFLTAPDGTSNRAWPEVGLIGAFQLGLEFDRYDVCTGVESEMRTQRLVRSWV